MSFCALCRVPSTEEHKVSGWHQHNEKLQSQGKMPMSQDLFQRFESQRYKKGKKGKKGKKKTITSTSTATSTSTVNKKMLILGIGKKEIVCLL